MLLTCSVRVYCELAFPGFSFGYSTELFFYEPYIPVHINIYIHVYMYTSSIEPKLI